MNGTQRRCEVTRTLFASNHQTVSPHKWLWPVILAVLLVGGLLWFTNRKSSTHDKGVNTVANKASTAASHAANQAPNASSLGPSVKTSIPSGERLNIPENGMESKLLVFIKDPNAPIRKETWFVFDRLNFATDLANLQVFSQEQLENLAKILRAYPNVHVRIGGHTDNQGDAAANLKFSQDRANSVMAQLVARGVDPWRLEARGYGEDHPVADNPTESAENRSITLQVTRK